MTKSTGLAKNPIEADIEAEIIKDGQPVGTTGPVATIARQYKMDSVRLIGLLLKLDYQEMHIATCDPWKRKCGGVPRNSFVIVKVSAAHVGPEDKHFCDRIILARVTDSVPTPLRRSMNQNRLAELQADISSLAAWAKGSAGGPVLPRQKIFTTFLNSNLRR